MSAVQKTKFVLLFLPVLLIQAGCDQTLTKAPRLNKQVPNVVSPGDFLRMSASERVTYMTSNPEYFKSIPDRELLELGSQIHGPGKLEILGEGSNRAWKDEKYFGYLVDIALITDQEVLFLTCWKMLPLQHSGWSNAALKIIKSKCNTFEYRVCKIMLTDYSIRGDRSNWPEIKKAVDGDSQKVELIEKLQKQVSLPGN